MLESYVYVFLLEDEHSQSTVVMFIVVEICSCTVVMDPVLQ